MCLQSMFCLHFESLYWYELFAFSSANAPELKMSPCVLNSHEFEHLSPPCFSLLCYIFTVFHRHILTMFFRLQKWWLNPSMSNQDFQTNLWGYPRWNHPKKEMPCENGGNLMVGSLNFRKRKWIQQSYWGNLFDGRVFLECLLLVCTGV